MVTPETLQQLLNQALNTGEFPGNLKNADVTLFIFFKKTPLNKDKYRRASVLPVISKVFEKLIQNQINLHAKCFLSPYLFCCRKGFISGYALVSLI